MSDQFREEIPEIVDLDECSKKKSVLVGAAFALALSLVPYTWILFGLHLLICAAVAVGHFAKRYKVTVSFMTGAKIGTMASVLAIVVFYFVSPFWAIRNFPEEQWDTMKSDVIEQLYESGQPDAAAEITKMDFATILPYVLIAAFIVFVLFSAVLGFFGGGIGSALYKKGPEAQ